MSKTLLGAARIAAWSALAATAFACASVAPPPRAVQAAPMPPGGEWEGVYQGPYHIYLRIERTGTEALGNWRGMGGRAGELRGKVNGNLLEFSFTERDLQTQNSWSGRGYFVYQQSEPGALPELRGAWGLGTSDSDGEWYAVKRPEVALSEAASKLTDSDSVGSSAAEESGGASECIGASCVGDDRGTEEPD